MREGIRPPKFADKFALLDFDASLMPAISLYPVPEAVELPNVALRFCGLDCKPRCVHWSALCGVQRVTVSAPLVCQIFNWSEVVEWQGVRFGDVLQHLGMTSMEDEYFSFYSRDGIYFEALPGYLARDPRVLLATHVNGKPLPAEHGGPLRLVVPFLQGYKSVKWLDAIRVTKHDPVGTKRLLGQSKTAHLGKAWRDTYGIEQEPGAERTPV